MNTQHHHQAEPKSSRAGPARLSDTALLLLGHAGTRPDGLVLPPPAALRARGSALTKVLASLVKAGLVSEVPVETESWRTAEDKQRIGLKITAAGLAAIGIEPPPAKVGETSVGTAPVVRERRRSKDVAQTPAPLGQSPELATGSAPAVRRITKQVKLVTLLSGDHGQSVAALAEALSWQQHTVRAALTGLRQKGHVLSKTKDAAGTTVYRIMAPDAARPNGAILAA